MLSMLVYYHPSTLLLKTFVEHKTYGMAICSQEYEKKTSYTETPYSVGDTI